MLPHNKLSELKKALLDGYAFPCSVDFNKAFVTHLDHVAMVVLGNVPGVPNDEIVFACFSEGFFLYYMGVHYDTVKDVQDAYHSLYALDPEELQELENDGSDRFRHATLMLCRECDDVRQCRSCLSYFDGSETWEDGERNVCLTCPCCSETGDESLFDKRNEFGT